MATNMNDDLKWALDDLTARQGNYTDYNRYYNGDHKLAFATDKFTEAFGSLMKSFADNLCPVVVDTIVDRLVITGFASTGLAAGETDRVTEVSDGIWRLNRMDRKAADVHEEALRCGDAYVIVWPDEDNQPHIWVNQAHMCTVRYDQEHLETITKAAKMWYDGDSKYWRLTLYYPDRIEKYGFLSDNESAPSSATQFQPFAVSGEPWPLPNPYGVVPVFHFANAAKPGAFGVSELSNAIPIQDALNKTVCDLLIAQEFIAYPQRWITGVETELDETTGLPKQVFIPGVNRVWTVGAPDATLGQFPGADLTQYTQVKESFREDMAIVTRTPLHNFKASSNDYPSGVALTIADGPLVAKVKRRQVVWGNIWEDVLGLCLSMAGVGHDALDCVWADTQPHDDEVELKNLETKKRLGVSGKQVLREAGYTDAQIEQFEQENQVAAEELGNQLLTAFDRDSSVSGRSSGQVAQNNERQQDQ